MCMCMGSGETFVFQYWDNPAIYQFPPERLLYPNLFRRQKGPGMYLLVCSADGMRAACWSFYQGLISSSRQLVHVPNNICKSGFMLPAGHSPAASWLWECRQCSETCAKLRYFKTANDNCLQNSCEFSISGCTEMSVTPTPRRRYDSTEYVVVRLWRHYAVFHVLLNLLSPLPAPDCEQKPHVREEVKARPILWGWSFTDSIIETTWNIFEIAYSQLPGCFTQLEKIVVLWP